MTRQRWARDDRGITLPELLVAMIVMSILAALTIGIVMWSNRATTNQTRDGELWADMQDASTQMLRDVNDAQTITVAEANRLVVHVIRDDKCQERDWLADTANKRLTVTTRFFEQRGCDGPSTTREDRIIGDNAIGTNAAGSRPSLYTSTATFSYHDTLSAAALAFPVEPDRVSRIEWTLTAQADTNMRVETLKSGAAFTGRGSQSTGDGPQGNPTNPLLCLSLPMAPTDTCGGVQPRAAAASGKFEGVDQPVLQWVDTSPTLTQGWTVWRAAGPEGAPTTDPLYSTWTAVLTSASPATNSWTDTTLPAGYTAQYVVRATTSSGVGPTSNQVVTGIRPAATTVTAAGATQSIAVTWTARTGATGYDVYRDGRLIANLGAVTSFTDQSGQTGWTGTGYGHSHYYRVVPVNRWESRLTGNTDTFRVPANADITTAYTGGARLASAQTAASGDFTAPATPTLTVTASAGRENVVSWTAAAWTGSGPTTGRVTGWQVWYRSSSETQAQVAGSPMAAATLTWTHTSRPAGRYSEYAVRGVNASGSGSLAGWDREWQRPATPTCTVSGATTRSLTVTGSLANTSDETYTTGNLGVRRDIDTTWSTNGKVFDPLTHSGNYAFHVRAYGPSSGLYSDNGSCIGSTAALGVEITGVTPTTRSVTATMSTTAGTASDLTLQGVRTDSGVTSATWDPLTHGGTYTVTARNTDGHNWVQDDETVTLPVVAPPGAPPTPTCSYQSTDSSSPGSFTINAVTDGRYRIGSGSWGTSRTFSGLGVGTYRGSVYRVGGTATDGHNVSAQGPDSGIDYCPYVTVTASVPAAPTGLRVTRMTSQAYATWLGGSGGGEVTSFDWTMHEWSPAGGYYAFAGSGSTPVGTKTTPFVGITSYVTWPYTQPMIRVQARAVGPGGTSGWVTAYSTM